MQNWRCKCGESTAFGSMWPQDCEGCDQCNTTVRSMNVTQLIDMQESLDKLNKFLEDHLNNKKK
jgi:hypothetical protein